MSDTKIKGGVKGATTAVQGGEGSIPAAPDKSKKADGDVAKSGFAHLEAPFGKYIAERFTTMAGRQNYYASGSPHVSVKNGESVTGIGKLKWTQPEYESLCHFVAGHINPVLQMQIKERVGEAGFQKFVAQAAKTIADYHTPADYSPVIAKEGVGQKVS